MPQFGRLVWRRTRTDGPLLGALLVGTLIAATVLSGAWVYLRSLDHVGVRATVDGLGPALLNVNVDNAQMPFTKAAFDQSRAVVEDAARPLGNLVQSDASVVQSPRILWGPASQGVNATATAPRTILTRITHLDAHVRYVAGRAPSEVVNANGPLPVVEVAAPAARAGAKEIQVHVGDVLEVGPGKAPYGHFLAVVTGLFEPTNPNEAFWAALGDAWLAPEAPMGSQRPNPLPLFLRGDAIWQVTAQSSISVGEGRWLLYLNKDTLRQGLPTPMSQELAQFGRAAQRAIPTAFVMTGPESEFRSLHKRSVFAEAPTYLMGILLLTITVYFGLLVASLLAERRRREVSVLRSRGINTLQIGWLYGVEFLPLVAIPVIVAPFLAMALVALLGKLGAYRAVTGGSFLPVDLGWVPFVWAVGTGVVAMALLLVPAMWQSRGSVVVERRTAARPNRAPFFQRYFLDAAFLLLGGLILWELEIQKSATVASSSGQASTDVATLFGPVLILTAVALFFLRIFPLVMRVAAASLRRWGSVWLVMGFLRLARSPYRYSWPILLFVLAAGLSVLATTLSSTLARSTSDQIAYQTAADIRVVDVSATGGADGSTMQTVRSLPGVENAALAVRDTQSAFGPTGNGESFTTLAVDPTRFADVSWFRPDFASASLSTLMNQIKSGAPAPLIPIPNGTTKIGAWARANPTVPNLFLWVVIQDAQGRTVTMTLGAIKGPNWNYQSGEIPQQLDYPANIVSVLVYQPGGKNAGSVSNVYLADFDATYTGSDGETHKKLVLPFDSTQGWAVLPSSQGLDTSFSISPGGAPPGAPPSEGVGLLKLGNGTDSGVRGVYRAISGNAIPVIASTGFLSANQTNVGSTFVAQVFGVLAPFKIVNTVSYFPTLDPNATDFIVGDFSGLFRYVQFRGGSVPNQREELYVSTAPGQSQQVASELSKVSGVTTLSEVSVRATMASKALIDPLVVAGWRGVALVTLGGTLIIVVLGYLTYLMSYAARGRMESAFLSTLGIASGSYFKLIALEHLLIGAIGLSIGTVAGFAMTRLATQSVAHTQTGGAIVPPFVLTTQWFEMGLLYGALVLVGAISLLQMVWQFRTLPLAEMTRVEE